MSLKIHTKYYPEAKDGLPVDFTEGIRPGIIKSSIDWIIIHEAGNPNPNAGADAHLAYLKNLTIANRNTYNYNVKNGIYAYSNLYWISYNYFVQGNKKNTTNTGLVYNIIPDNEVAWTNSDGRTAGGGNMNGISIEIADSVTYDLEDGYRRAIELVAYLLHKHNLKRENIKAHQDFAPNKKMCPYQLLRDKRFEWFKDEAVRVYEETYVNPSSGHQFEAGDDVYVTGTLYSSSSKGTPVIEEVENERMTIVSVSENGDSPFEVARVGYVTEASMEYIKPNPPTGGTIELKVGDDVEVSGTVYSSAWGATPSVQLGKKKTKITSIITTGAPSFPYLVGSFGFTNSASITKL